MIVNVQGDLPTLDGALRCQRGALDPLAADGAVDISTLVCEITDDSEHATGPAWSRPWSPGSQSGDIGRCLYFSRATVPTGPGPLLHHIGLYGFRRQASERFVDLPQGALERRERLEQLRALEAGMRIDAALVATVPLGVDTEDDLDRARRMLNPLTW